MSDKIEAFITELFKNEQNDYLELGRNELAQIFNCVPSQINYVIQTRFNPARGYNVESKRGGGGYIRIYKISENDLLLNILNSIPPTSSARFSNTIIENLLASKLITLSEARIMLSAVSDACLLIDEPARGKIRSNILKNMIYNIRKD